MQQVKSYINFVIIEKLSLAEFLIDPYFAFFDNFWQNILEVVGALC